MNIDTCRVSELKNQNQNVDSKLKSEFVEKLLKNRIMFKDILTSYVFKTLL